MQILFLLDGVTVRARTVDVGSYLAGTGSEVDIRLPSGSGPARLCRIAIDRVASGEAKGQLRATVTEEEPEQAPLSCPDGTTVRARLYNGDHCRVGRTKILALESLETGDAIVDDPFDPQEPTAASDGVAAPSKEGLVLQVEGERGVQTIGVRDGLLIGRHKEIFRLGGLRLPNRAVSRKHARIDEDVRGFLLQDTGSRHGTFLNGVRLEKGEAKRLEDAMVLTLSRNPKVPRVLVRSAQKLLARPPAKVAGAVLIGESPAMQKLRAGLIKAARGKAVVLLLGETGTGKGQVARWFAKMVNGKLDLVKVDCPTLPGPLFEQELFGHEAGAFTDAKTEQKGRI